MKPDIPKALAARIRGAQRKLEDQIQTHIWAQREISEIEKKLADFEADPVGWAETNYPGHGPDSYPVQTHISRASDALIRKKGRRSAELQALANAQENLRLVEQEVLDKISRLRPTSGRVPWPEPLADIPTYARELQAWKDEHAARSAIGAREREAAFQEEMRQLDAEQHERDRQGIRDLVAQGPEEVIMTGLILRTASEAYKDFNNGVVAFAYSQEARAAEASGRAKALRIISDAKSRGVDLWNVVRELGFPSPETLS